MQNLMPYKFQHKSLNAHSSELKEEYQEEKY
jgi:hypothetical protein